MRCALLAGSCLGSTRRARSARRGAQEPAYRPWRRASMDRRGGRDATRSSWLRPSRGLFARLSGPLCRRAATGLTRSFRAMMDVFEAINSRIACRQFVDKAVGLDTVRDLIRGAARAPSSLNLQALERVRRDRLERPHHQPGWRTRRHHPRFPLRVHRAADTRLRLDRAGQLAAARFSTDEKGSRDRRDSTIEHENPATLKSLWTSVPGIASSSSLLPRPDLAGVRTGGPPLST
jgi:hypothetical protein